MAAFTLAQLSAAQNAVQHVLHRPLPCSISASQADVLSVSWDEGEAAVPAPASC